jgi:hypothetical protein
MTRFFALCTFYLCSSGIALATPLQCPNLSIKTDWKLDKNFINYHNEKWYISRFVHEQQSDSGGTFPLPLEPSRLVSAQSINLEKQLGRQCIYKVITDKKSAAKVFIQRMGN